MGVAELISCHDCERPVSFSAAACPNCGLREPSGPYRFSASEARRLGAEDRNDKRVLQAVAAGIILGLAYGVSISTSKLTVLFYGPLYAMVCVIIAVPIAVAINLFKGRP
jgi:hypothetical protein